MIIITIEEERGRFVVRSSGVLLDGKTEHETLLEAVTEAQKIVAREKIYYERATSFR